MEAWVFTCSDSPLEHWLDGFETRFDAWEEGGVTGIVVGRMAFRQDDGSTIPAYAPDPEVYKALGAEVPAPSPRDLEKENLILSLPFTLTRYALSSHSLLSNRFSPSFSVINLPVFLKYA